MLEGRISIIIPCYNCEKTVENSLRSVENQTYRDLEVILIDDGSKDGTLSKLHDYQKTSSKKVIVQHQENGGVSVARNKGLELASGQYIAFLDSDDTFSDDALASMYQGYSTPDIDIVYGFFTRELSKIECGSLPREADEIYSNNSIQTTMHVVMNEKNRLGFTTFLFRKDIIDNNNIYFPVGLKTGEDLEFLWKYLVYCSKAVEVNKYLYWYYDNPDSAVHKVEWTRTNSYESILRITNMMREENCDFAETFSKYMGARYIWSYAKTFSVGHRKDLFKRLVQEYPVKRGMLVLLKQCPDIRVRLTAALYLINKYLFYYAIAIIRR